MNEKKGRTVAKILLSVVFVLLGCVSYLQAQESFVSIEVDPDIRKIELGESKQEIALVARSTKQNLVFEWKLHGPGELLGDAGSPGVFYVTPQKTEGTAEQATVILKVRDEQGNSLKKSIIFTLLNSRETIAPPLPTPTASPIPQPTATSTPTPRPRIPTPTPTLPIFVPAWNPDNCPQDSKSIEDLIQRRLPQELNAYKRLKKRENNREFVSEEQMGEILENILCDLTSIEKLLEENYNASGDTEILDRIRKIQKTRNQYEQELLSRRRQHQM